MNKYKYIAYIALIAAFLNAAAIILLLSVCGAEYSNIAMVPFIVMILSVVISAIFSIISLNFQKHHHQMQQQNDKNKELLNEIECQKQKEQEKQAAAAASEKIQKQQASDLQNEICKQNELQGFCSQILSCFSREFGFVQGLLYIKTGEGKENVRFRVNSTYAYHALECKNEFAPGEGLPGLAAEKQKFINIDEVPEGYITVLSGTGKSNPANLLIVPVVYDNQTIAVIELASFQKIPEETENLIKDILQGINSKLNELIRQKQPESSDE